LSATPPHTHTAKTVARWCKAYVVVLSPPPTHTDKTVARWCKAYVVVILSLEAVLARGMMEELSCCVS
jgi:hypothetical protein